MALKYTGESQDTVQKNYQKIKLRGVSVKFWDFAVLMRYDRALILLSSSYAPFAKDVSRHI